LANLIDKIEGSKGTTPSAPFFLSNGTPVVSAIIPLSALSRFPNDPAIYGIEEALSLRVSQSQGAK
jgi:hypothetical protein